VAHLVSGAELARGYSSSMSVTPEGGWLGVRYVGAWAALVAAGVLSARSTRMRATGAALVLPTFFAWKHGVIRTDGHLHLLVLFGFFVLALLLVDATLAPRRRLAVAFLGLAALALLRASPVPFTQGLGGPRALSERLLQPLRGPGIRSLVRLSDLRGYLEDLEQQSADALRDHVLPPALRERIGSASVDFFPWDVAYAPANGLAWRPRPLPASFNAFTPLLDAGNARFLESERRAEFVLWHSETDVRSIDGRHLFWDAPQALRAMLDGYDLVWAEAGLLLLRSRGTNRFADPEPFGAGSVGWGEWLDVPDARGVLLARVGIERPLSAVALRTLFREAPVFLSLRFASGDEHRYRFLPDNAAGGLWLSPLPVRVAELRSLLGGGPGRHVVAVRFDHEARRPPARRIEITWLRMLPRGQPDLVATPIPVPPVADMDRDCAGEILFLRSGRDWHGRRAIYASGWARDGAEAFRGAELWLTDARGRWLPTSAHSGGRRPDVARELGRASLAESGWWAVARLPGAARGVGFVIRGRDGAWLASCNRADESGFGRHPDPDG
jgi:hypothetical protein